MTAIEWTDETWNPTTGCDRVSPGCARCYALTMAARLKAMGQPDYQTDGDPRTSGPGFGVAVHPRRLSVPFRWKRRRRRVFVDSMADLFHEAVPDAFLDQVFAVMALAKGDTFQVLTKRPERMRRYLSDPGTYRRVRREVEEGEVWRLYWETLAQWEKREFQGRWWTPLPPDRWPLPNAWMGVSVENQRWADQRIPLLLDTPAAVRFLSCEPLLGPLDLGALYGDSPRRYLRCVPCAQGGTSTKQSGAHACHLDPPNRVDWVIVGGESGPGARPIETGWIEDVVRQCRASGTAVFVKQMGARWAAGERACGVQVDRKGGRVDAWPDGLRVQEFPR